MNNVSVLMSIYKNDSLLYFNQAIDSILKQTEPPDQIVLVRDGEVKKDVQDRLNELAVECKDFIKIIELKSNVGLSKALNIGIDNCDYEYIARMDADDISLPNRLSEQMRIMIRDKSISLLSAWVDQYNEDMSAIKTIRKVPESNIEIIKYSKRRTPFNHTCSIFRKDAVVKSGKYPDIQKSFCEDWWLSLRLIKNGYKLHNIQKSLLMMRTGNDFYKRRYGFSYLKIEYYNLNEMYKSGLFSFIDLLINLSIRLPVRLLPLQFVELFYKKMNYAYKK